MVASLIQFEFNEWCLGLFSDMHELKFLPDEFNLESVQGVLDQYNMMKLVWF
jgi:hypothetical protein